MGVLAESLRSPCRTEEGLLEESSLYENCMRGPWGVLEESLWSPCGLHVNFKESGRASAILGLVLMDSLRTPEEVPVNSHITPWRLPGLDEDSFRTPQLRVAQCHDLPSSLKSISPCCNCGMRSCGWRTRRQCKKKNPFWPNRMDDQPQWTLVSTTW